MRMKSVALLTGNYDWNPALVPPSECDARLAAVRAVVAAHGAHALIVHGDSSEYSALAYLTGFTPKLGPALAFIPPHGRVRLLTAGTEGMLDAARRLTWVEQMRAIGEPAQSIAEELRLLSGGSATLATWGCRTMPRRLHSLLTNAARDCASLLDLEAPLNAILLRRSPVELDLTRAACRCLEAAHRAFSIATLAGAGTRSAAIAAERAAFRAGAQDFRILASARPGGPPLPFFGTADPVVAPVLICMETRFAGCCAEGMATVAAGDNPAALSAEAALQSLLDSARAGVRMSGLAAPHSHPFVQHAACASPGHPANQPVDALEAGGIYTLRAGAAGSGAESAIVSATIAVHRDTTEILWRGTCQ